MKRKYLVSIFFTLLMALSVFFSVFAGSTRDWGYLVSSPPVGEVNYYAWITSRLTTGGVPREIMTEDGYNPSDGPDGGYIYYQDSNLEPPFAGPIWRIQARNFAGLAEEHQIGMVFGGIGASSESLWYFQFEYTLNPSIKYWGEVTNKVSGVSCPILYSVDDDLVAETRTVKFQGEPNKYYQLYRTTQGSGAEPDNGLGGGRYQWLAEVGTNQYGFGEYTDADWDVITYGSWYVVLFFDKSGSGLHGCHSEEGVPTNVRVFDFSAEYLPETHVVDLAWKTASELNMRGFNVLRATSPTGPTVTLNEALIEADPPGTLEGSYAFTDDDLGDAQTYYYWVEIVEFEGRQDRVGPVMVTITNGGETYKYYLPMILK